MHRSSTSDTQPERPDIETASDEYAARFGGRAGQFFLAKQAKCVGEMLTGGIESVLEVGGGHGQLIPVYEEQGMTVTIQGTDESCFEQLNRRYPGNAATYVTSELLQLPFDDDAFDAVVAVRLISHLTHWDATISEMCRVARKCVVIDYPSVFALNALTPIFFQIKKKAEGNTRTYQSFSRTKLAKAFDQSGFSISRSRSQFTLPMFVHRKASGAPILQSAESFFESSGITRLFGSPVVARADRR
jgi:ubiquinone/menaquinone biosynthesis C-methylase UbiE